MGRVNIDWSKLGFGYIKTPLRYMSRWHDGVWDEGDMVEENTINMSECATVLQYGQQCFEGLKAYRRKDGRIQLFRPDENAKRLQNSCKRLMMPEVPVDKFVSACIQVVRANEVYVPPYGTGGTLYIRPILMGVGDTIAVVASSEFIFRVFCMPVGPYFKGGMAPVKLSVTDFDRAAPNGMGAAKTGGNYAGSLLPHELAVKQGYADCIYLDPATHTKIEETGGANFFAVTKDNKLVTPKSSSILPSITKYSLMYIAKEYAGMEVEERDIYIDKLDEFVEAGVCGTAAVITPVGSLEYKGKAHVFYSETAVGAVTKRLYDTLCGIQFGDIEAPAGWIVEA